MSSDAGPQYKNGQNWQALATGRGPVSQVPFLEAIRLLVLSTWMLPAWAWQLAGVPELGWQRAVAAARAALIASLVAAVLMLLLAFLILVMRGYLPQLPELPTLPLLPEWPPLPPLTI